MTAIILTPTATVMNEIAPLELYRLLSWLSPSYPTGAFNYSHGIEFAVERDLVADRLSLIDWVSYVLRHGSGWVDAVHFSRAYDAAADEDWRQLSSIAELSSAMRGTAEMALESRQQGRAFLTITRVAWPEIGALKLQKLDEKMVTLPIAFAVACVGSVSRGLGLLGLLQAFIANLVSAAVRLIPLGQTDGQIAIAALAQVAVEVAELAASCPLDDVGTAAPMVDWASMRHETQYTRLFRS